ncbi:MAG: 30S ribosomal protein S9 [archaeon]
MTEKQIVVSGKRKRAVAKAKIVEGKGEIRINKENYQKLNAIDRLRIEEPLRITKQILGETKFNIEIIVKGGGEKGQLEAVRLAVARAISKFSNSPELTNAFLKYDRNLLIADVRRKEAYKPGDSKARRKRQKSYR